MAIEEKEVVRAFNAARGHNQSQNRSTVIRGSKGRSEIAVSYDQQTQRPIGNRARDIYGVEAALYTEHGFTGEDASKAIDLMKLHGKEAVVALVRHGSKALQVIANHGETGAVAILNAGQNAHHAVGAITNAGENGRQVAVALARLSQNLAPAFAERLAAKPALLNSCLDRNEKVLSSSDINGVVGNFLRREKQPVAPTEPPEPTAEPASSKQPPKLTRLLEKLKEYGTSSDEKIITDYVGNDSGSLNRAQELHAAFSRLGRGTVRYSTLFNRDTVVHWNWLIPLITMHGAHVLSAIGDLLGKKIRDPLRTNKTDIARIAGELHDAEVKRADIKRRSDK